MDEALGDDVGPWLAALIGGDRRFFFLAEAGARGAYWDILRGGRLATP